MKNVYFTHVAYISIFISYPYSQLVALAHDYVIYTRFYYIRLPRALNEY